MMHVRFSLIIADPPVLAGPGRQATHSPATR
jgi:hypothetical protein